MYSGEFIEIVHRAWRRRSDAGGKRKAAAAGAFGHILRRAGAADTRVAVMRSHV